MIKGIKDYEGFNITFQVTEDCNLACKYCYEVDKKPANLPISYAYKFIDLILTEEDPIGVIGTDKEYILRQGLVIDFIGGDALMLPNLCREILVYFQYKAYELDHRWKDRWRCSISTNGTLFDREEVQKFLNDYKDNISLGISIDGCPEIHDKNRVMKNGSGSMKHILKNIDFYKNYAGTYANTKATLNKDSIPYLYKSIKFLHEDIGFKYINMNFIFENMDLNEENYKEIECQFEKIIQYIYEHKDDIHINMFNESFGIGEPYGSVDIHSGWCGAGAMPCLSVNGKIYPCFRFAPNTMHNRDKLDFYVGDVWNGFTRKDRFVCVQNQTREKISPEKCKMCSIESTCAWCIGGAFSEKGKFYRTTNLCRIKKLIDKYSRLYWNKYWEANKYEICSS